MNSTTSIGQAVRINPRVRDNTLDAHAHWVRHWFNASGTDAYRAQPIKAPFTSDVAPEVELVDYRLTLHRKSFPEADSATIGLIDKKCESLLKRSSAQLVDGRQYCGLCDEHISPEKWNAHRLTPTHATIEFSVQMIYDLWRTIAEVRRRKDEVGK